MGKIASVWRLTQSCLLMTCLKVEMQFIRNWGLLTTSPYREIASCLKVRRSKSLKVEMQFIRNSGLLTTSSYREIASYFLQESRNTRKHPLWSNRNKVWFTTKRNRSYHKKCVLKPRCRVCKVARFARLQKTKGDCFSQETDTVVPRNDDFL